MLESSGREVARRYTRRALRSSMRLLDRVQRRIERTLTAEPAALTPHIAGVEEAFSAGFESCPCIFVLSTGRVGTETLAALLAQSPGVYSVHEPRPLLLRVTYEAYLARGEGKCWVDILRAARGETIAAAAARGQTYSETNPRMTLVAQQLAEAFPDSRFVHLHRHPHDVIYSCLRRAHYRGHPYDHARIQPREGEPYRESWEAMSVLEKVAWNWAETNSLALQFMSTLPPERRLDLPSQEMFAGDPEKLAALFALAGVELPDAVLLREVLQSQLNRQVGGLPATRPENWTREERHTVDSIVGDVASAMGYAPALRSIA